jgi:hypothetical protein
VIKSVTLDAFRDGRQEVEFELPPLEGGYELVTTAQGEGVPEGELVQPFERTRYEWEHLGLGTTRKVYPPFTPIRIQGKEVSTVLREHTMNDCGLWEQVVAKDAPLLAEPMRFAATVDGAPVELRGRGLRFTEQAEDRAVAEAGFSGGAVSAEIRSTWDYDGMMRVDMTLAPTGGKTVDALTLEIPLRGSAARLFHAMGDSIRNTLYEAVPAGQGVVWTSEKVGVSDFPPNFCTYIFVGNPVRGLCWFAENDRGWSWDPQKPNLDLVRKGNTVTLRVHLVNKPVVITQPRTITFGLQAAPVKPRLGDWRHAWWRQNYTVLGGDLNWFGQGAYASIYPAGRDLKLWEYLHRGNTEQVSDDLINEVIQYGMKYFEPHGMKDTYEAHVRYNMRSRYGKKMILYYNRASFQAAPEFQTFQDEWCLTDYRTVGPGDSIGEIKVVPTDSYIDQCLYWYGKAFDIAGSVGVYWDNLYFAASYNRMTTAAYEREDGSIMPSTGVWGLRELAKRTFQYMNERGMAPITMAHMTSASMLPLLSFCTVQYDWEWKYSEGDVQYRFPREYILLVSNGDLCGTWPVLLPDHGPLAQDPWTQRTFAAVCIVHEMTEDVGFWGVYKEVWEPLMRPIFEILDMPGVEAYRYWDERPQPVVADRRDLPTIVYSVKGERAVFAVASYAESDVDATLTIDREALGLLAPCRILDVETGEPVELEQGKLPIRIKKHDIREFMIVPGEVR